VVEVEEREGGETILKTREMGIGEEEEVEGGDKSIREVMRNRQVSN